MKPKRRGSKDITRDDVISRARYGQITPEEAEAEAKAYGWEPFASEPPLPDFDPMQESRWSMVMTVAWIAWRDLQLVREQHGEFRSKSTLWIFREWNEVTAGGNSFRRQKGWFLETWHQATTVRLGFLQRILERRSLLPATAQMDTDSAELGLWRALSDGHLVAEALDVSGRPIDIPQREWSFLKLYEDGKKDVLKYDSLDRDSPYYQVKFKRDDVLRLWPMVLLPKSDVLKTNYLIDSSMIAPIAGAGSVGYVPLCSAIHWIMTGGGRFSVAFDDGTGWRSASEKLFPLIHTGQIELLGAPRARSLTEKISGHTLALVKVIPPLGSKLEDVVLEAPSHISCTPYIDHEHWSQGFNDQLFLSGERGPSWTHLQVRKDQILQHWPKPESRSKPEHDCYQWLVQEIERSPTQRPKPKASFWEEAKSKFPMLQKRQFERAWAKAVGEKNAVSWSKPGPRRARSDHRGK